MSSGLCYACTVSNCDACIGVGVNLYCTNCASEYYLAAGACYSCPSNCLECNGGTCTQCSAGYYVSSGACSSVSTTTTNCDIYSDATTCSSCVSGYYYSNSECLPCSILCSTCEGIHFGRCSACNEESSLFNEMCIVDPFPSTSYYRAYVGIPGNLNDLSGGSVECTSFYMGTSISLTLNDFSAYKLELKYMLFS